MNTPVSFEIAKLLKEKDYGNTAPWKLGRDYYNHLGELNGDVTDYIRAFVKLKDRKNRNELTHLETIDAPTIAEVVMWLYEKHGIWIQGPFPYNNGKWEWVIFLLNEPLKDTDGYKNVMSLHHEPYKFNSPTEAYEAAIEYCLTKLI